MLAHEGLRPAVEALADRSPRLVVGELPAERFAAPWSRRRTSWWPSRCAAAGDGDVAVSARREDGRLLVELEAAGGIVGSTTDLEDRSAPSAGRSRGPRTT